jgi:hypothetical protein
MAGGGYPKQSTETYAQALKRERAIRRPATFSPLAELPVYQGELGDAGRTQKLDMSDEALKARRRSASGEDLFKKRIDLGLNFIKKFSKSPIGRKINTFNNIRDAVDTAVDAREYLREKEYFGLFDMSPIRLPAIYTRGDWTECVAYSACFTEPVFEKHEISLCPGTNVACLNGQAFATLHALGTPPGPTITRVIFTSAKNLAGTRVSHVRAFIKGAGSVVGRPNYVGGPQVVGFAVEPRTWFASAQPSLIAIGWPASTPQPLPFRMQVSKHRPNSGTAQAEAHSAGYHSSLASPHAQPSPHATPKPHPGIGADFPPNGPPVIVTNFPKHKHSPTAKHTKERKLNLTPHKGIGLALNFATEGTDFLVALHKGLPHKYRAKRTKNKDARTGREFTSRPSLHDMAQAIYKNFDKVSMSNFMAAWAANEAKDAAIGRYNRPLRDGNKNAGNYVRGNLAFGPAL